MGCSSFRIIPQCCVMPHDFIIMSILCEECDFKKLNWHKWNEPTTPMYDGSPAGFPRGSAWRNGGRGMGRQWVPKRHTRPARPPMCRTPGNRRSLPPRWPGAGSVANLPQGFGWVVGINSVGIMQRSSFCFPRENVGLNLTRKKAGAVPRQNGINISKTGP